MDEDDFDDFGGFEAAEPVDPAEAAAIPQGLQAAPSPWALFSDIQQQPADTPVSQQQQAVNCQPDLLQAQAQIRPSLEPPFPQDQPGAQAVAPDPSTSTSSLEEDAGFADFESMLDLPKQQTAPSGVRSFSEQVLEPQFGWQAAAIKPIPDGVLDLDLSKTRERAAEVESGISLELDDTDSIALQPAASGEVREPQNTGANVEASAVNAAVHVSSAGQPASACTENLPAGAGGVTESASCNSQQEPNGELEVQLTLAEQEKNRLQQELEELLSRQTQAEQQVAKTREELNHLKQQYRDLQTRHAEQLEELREAGHEALTIIVQEYKELCCVAVAEQQQVASEKLQQTVRDEAEKWQQHAQRQEEKLKQGLETEREESSTRLEKALEEQQQQQQLLIEKALREEREKSTEQMEKAIQERQESFQKHLHEAVEAERQASADLLQKQKNEFENQIKEMRETTQQEVQKALREEQIRCKECVREAVADERHLQEAARREAVEQTRQDMERYLQQQRQADATVRRRALTSIDLFLDSARQQLQLLLAPESASSDDGHMMDAQAER